VSRTVTLALSLLTGTACARAAPPLTPVDAVTSSLRAVATAQEAFFQDHHTYTTDLDALLRYPGCRVHRGVRITIHEAAADGWAASGSHRNAPDRSCVQWVSRPGGVAVPVTRREGRRADALPGGVVCDSTDDPPR